MYIFIDTKYLFYITLIISIIVQLITGIIELGAFFIKVPTNHISYNKTIINNRINSSVF